MIAAAGHPHQPRRQDLARRRRRPRHGQDLRLRRRGARGRHQDEAVHGPGRHRRRTRATSSRSTARPAGVPRRGAGRAVAGRPLLRGRDRPGRPTRPTTWCAACTGSSPTPTRVRRLAVRANADTPEDSARARRFGAQGIGLCRTEHMFLGDRRQLVETLILADSDEERNAALDQLRAAAASRTSSRSSRRWTACRSTIRLLDPPLHEFLPDLTELSVRVAIAEERGEHDEGDPAAARRRAGAARAEPDARAARRAARPGRARPVRHAGAGDRRGGRASGSKAGGDPRAEIMIPLVGAVQELETIREEAERVLAEVCDGDGHRRARHDRHDDRGAAGGAHRRTRSPRPPSSSRSAPTTSPR